MDVCGLGPRGRVVQGDNDACFVSLPVQCCFAGVTRPVLRCHAHVHRLLGGGHTEVQRERGCQQCKPGRNSHSLFHATTSCVKENNPPALTHRRCLVF